MTLKIPIRNKEKSDFISLADILVVFFSLLNSSKKETTEPINTNNDYFTENEPSIFI